EEHKELAVLDDFSGAVTSVAFSQGNDWLAVGTAKHGEGNLRLYNVDDATDARVLSSVDIDDVVFAGDRLVAVQHDGSVYVWNGETFELENQLEQDWETNSRLNLTVTFD